MLKRLWQHISSGLQGALARTGHAFIDRWGRVERSYRRPNAQIALRLGFWFYPLLTVLALGWLTWDWTHARTLAAAENAIFDQIITWRPWEPKPSRQVAVVAIDECSIEYYRAQGEGGWPWSRSRHADLLDVLDRAGVRAVGFDVQFVDASMSDPMSDSILDAMAKGGNGRFVFGSARLDPDYDQGQPRHVSQAPSAFPIVATPQRDPPVALLLPYGEAMRKNSALLNATRSADGILRDIPLRMEIGDWAIPSLPLRLAAGPHPEKMASYPAKVRINWRTRTHLPTISAADLLEGKPVCRDPDVPAPDLKGRTVLVGYTAAGLNDSKPTPVNPTMAGVVMHAEATEALLAGSAIWMPPAWIKYLLAALLVILTGYAFFRGEPPWELDQLFIASNLFLVLAAFIGLTAFGVFLDIFAAIGFVALCFGLCRIYSATQRGYAIGNDDYRPGFDPDRHPWLAMVRVRFVPDPHLEERKLENRVREFRRRLRRWMFAGTEAVALDCVVEYDSWFWDSLIDVTVLVWGGSDRADVIARAQRELDQLYQRLAGHDEVLPDDGSVRVSCVISIAENPDENISTSRVRVCEAVGQVLNAAEECPLLANNRILLEQAARAEERQNAENALRHDLVARGKGGGQANPRAEA